MVGFIIYVINRLIGIYAGIMLVYCLLGWFVRDPSNKFMHALAAITEPPLVPIRNLMHRVEFFRNSPVDYSPLVLFLLLRAVVGILGDLPGWFS